MQSKTLSTTSQRTSLHDIAPRLAVARDVRQMEVDHTGDCRECEATTDRYEARERLLVGCNTGQVHYSSRIKCRRCLTASYSNHGRLW